MKQTRNGLKDLSEKLDRASLAYDLATADDIDSRRKAASELVELVDDLLKDAKVVGHTPTRRAVQSMLKGLNRARSIKDAVEFVEPLIALGEAAIKLKEPLARSDRDLALLRDRLLPMQRRLSDRLDEAMRSPAIKEWLDGDLTAVCAEKS